MTSMRLLVVSNRTQASLAVMTITMYYRLRSLQTKPKQKRGEVERKGGIRGAVSAGLLVN